MRILLYEPGRTGHCDTILRYVERSVVAMHGEPLTVREDHAGAGELRKLRHRARELECDLVHVLTADGKVRDWIRDWSSLTSYDGCPIVATYYLYSNLYGGLSALPWNVFFAARALQAVQVPDERLGVRATRLVQGAKVHFVPDPWDPGEFRSVAKAEACAALGVSPNRCRLLVFGDLSRRKGVHTLVAAAAGLLEELPIEVLLVGALNSDDLPVREREQLADLVRRGRVVLHDRYVEERDVELYFGATDFVVCAYPPWFKVSSGTFIRACAAMRPTIGSDHGFVGETIASEGCGITFPSENVAALREAIRVGFQTFAADQVQAMGARGWNVARRRTIDCFTAQLEASYRKVLCRT